MKPRRPASPGVGTTDAFADLYGQMKRALELPHAIPEPIIEDAPARWSADFPVGALAVASVSAAAAALTAATGGRTIVDADRAQVWFERSLVPVGWSVPPTWDDVAGDYEGQNGWIKLHTNAPHHRRAALAVLGCAPDREAVAAAVAERQVDELESAILAAGGCAAAMRNHVAWSAHPQGQTVASEPLVHWRSIGELSSGSGPRLESLRVLDLTRVLAGPVATRMLAGFGAEVLRVDPPEWNEPALEPETTLGKRCASLDLTVHADRNTFEELLSTTDLLVHGYRPGALDGLGYGEETRRRIAPDLLEVSLCAYGWTGPWAGRRGFDSLVQMSTGIAEKGMAASGARRPVPLPVQTLDHATGYLMAAAALQAIAERRKGRIRHARLSLARTAQLLIDAAARGGEHADTPASTSSIFETTHWGPARRTAFPIYLNGSGPDWRYPAGPLRRSLAAWRAA